MNRGSAIPRRRLGAATIGCKSGVHSDGRSIRSIYNMVYSRRSGGRVSGVAGYCKLVRATDAKLVQLVLFRVML